jgi:hypothetical protein
LNSNPGLFCFIFLLPLFRLENRVCLSHGMQVAGAAWRAATRNVAGLGDLMQRTGDGCTGQVLDFVTRLTSIKLKFAFSNKCNKDFLVTTRY